MDRLEIIQLDGYLPDEKLEIAKRHLLGKQLEANGITRDNIIISDDILNEIIENYTREAGVRQLERSIASLCRKAAKEVVAGQECGMSFENYQDMRQGDVIECFRVEEIKRSL